MLETPSHSSPPAKAELRRTMRERLKTLAPADVAASSQAICAALAAHPAYVRAQVVALFDPLPREPRVDLLWQLAPRRFLYPRIEGDRLELCEVQDPVELQPVRGWALREPTRETKRREEGNAHDPGGFNLADVDLVLVPGLAFTPGGERLGRGGGYYDRLLSALPARTVKIGVCFERQVVAHLPTEVHDIRVDVVVTEARPQQ